MERRVGQPQRTLATTMNSQLKQEQEQEQEQATGQMTKSKSQGQRCQQQLLLPTGVDVAGVGLAGNLSDGT